jgi:hypothetical protein
MWKKGCLVLWRRLYKRNIIGRCHDSSCNKTCRLPFRLPDIFLLTQSCRIISFLLLVQKLVFITANPVHHVAFFLHLTYVFLFIVFCHILDSWTTLLEPLVLFVFWFVIHGDSSHYLYFWLSHFVVVTYIYKPFIFATISSVLSFSTTKRLNHCNSSVCNLHSLVLNAMATKWWFKYICLYPLSGHFLFWNYV